MPHNKTLACTHLCTKVLNEYKITKHIKTITEQAKPCTESQTFANPSKYFPQQNRIPPCFF